MTPSRPVPSPCVSVCRMEPDTGLCTGCLRTLDEIAGWGASSDADKRSVWVAIAARRAARASPGGEPASPPRDAPSSPPVTARSPTR